MVPGLSDAVVVAAGDSHSCAVRATGEIGCLGGFGFFGQLGNGSPYSTTPVQPLGLPSPLFAPEETRAKLPVNAVVAVDWTGAGAVDRVRARAPALRTGERPREARPAQAPRRWPNGCAAFAG